MAMDQARGAGFTTMIPPTLVKPRAMEGTGFLGQAADDVYRIEGEDMYLVGTSEVPLAAYHSDEILDADDVAAALRRVQPVLPQGGRLLRQGHPRASSGCTGSTRWRCSPTRRSRTSYAEHQRLLGWEKEWLDKLELAYRVIDTAAGDLGLSAQRKFDCEAWIPTQGQLPRAHLDVELHRLPGPPARHPRPLPGARAASSRWPPSTARWSRSRAPSSRSSRPTSRRTARCGCPQALQPYLQGRERAGAAVGR